MAAAASVVPPRPLPLPLSLHASPSPLPHAAFSHPHLPMAVFSRLRGLRGVAAPRLRRGLPYLAVAAAVRQDAAVWTQAPVTDVQPAADDGTLFHVSVDVSDSPDIAGAFTVPGQYLQLRVPDAPKPAFLAMASPPSVAFSRGVFEFLVKRVPGSTAELLCGLGKGDVVELSGVMGKGFAVDRFSPPEAVSMVLLFATGSGIRYFKYNFLLKLFAEICPIRSLIESGFSANGRFDVRLYYGARNLQKLAYQDRFRDWESSGIKITPVLSQPDDKWNGERGYVQAAFGRVKPILDPSCTGAVLCGHKQMMEDVTSSLVEDGVSKEKILKNF